MRNKILLPAAGGLAILAIVVYAWYFGWFGGEASSSQLERQALHAATEDQQAQAAAQLAQKGGEAKTHLRRTYQQSTSSRVKAASIVGLGEADDYESVELLFQALENESPLVRASAGQALDKLLGFKLGFRATDPPEERAKKIVAMRRAWEEMKSSGAVEQYLRRTGQ